jgi:hypothetical protein
MKRKINVTLLVILLSAICTLFIISNDLAWLPLLFLWLIASNVLLYRLKCPSCNKHLMRQKVAEACYGYSVFDLHHCAYCDWRSLDESTKN